jgi:uncharacterized membrane protein
MSSTRSASPPFEGPVLPPDATSTGLDPKVAGCLTYLFGWVTGLLVLRSEERHQEVRFHAAQSVLLSLSVLGVALAFTVVAMIPVVGLLALLGYAVAGVGAFGLWVFLLIQGYHLNHVRLPVLGELAEQWVAK